MTRLDSVSPALAKELQHASAAKQRGASLAASEFAVTRAGIGHPIVVSSLEQLRATGSIRPAQKAELDALAARLDDQYFALQEAAEEGQADAGKYLQVFGHARAVAALSFAGNEDAFQAATEAIYEATTTGDDNEELFAVVRSALR